MKKIIKTACAAVMVAATASSVTAFVNPKEVNAMPSVSQYATETGEYLDQVKVTGLTNATLGQPYTLPSAKMGTKDPTNITVSYHGINVPVNSNKVDIKYIGTYTISYTFDGGYVATVDFRAEKEALSLSDVSALLPLKLPTTFNQTLTLPMPEASDKDGKSDSAVVSAIVTAPGSINLPVNAEGVVDFTAAKVDGKLTLGNYHIKYVAKIGGVKVAESENYSFEVLDGYDVTELRYEYIGAKPTSWELGESKELPKVKGIDKISSSESEEVNVTYKVKKIVYSKDGDKSDVNLADVLDGMNFTPNKVGTYTISYEVKDFIGNTSSYIDDLVIEVKDNKDPVIKIVEAYTDATTTPVEALHKLPNAAAPEDIVVMPLWAEDKTEEGLKLSIIVEDRTSYSNVYDTTEHDNVVNKELVFNKSAGFTINDATQIDTGVNLVAGRTYRVYYKAVDKYNNDYQEYYDIKVSTDFSYSEDPVIEFKDVLPQKVENGDVITFSAPTFSDKNDERLLEKLEYRYGTEEYQPLVAEEDGSYKIVVDTALASLSIRAYAENNGGRHKEVVKNIEVVTVTDNDIPVVTTNGAFATGYKQGDTVELKKLTVSDANLDYVSISVKVEHLDDEGKATEMAVYGATTVTTTTSVGTYKELVGAKTDVSKKGNYRVTYTVRDAGNYAVIQYFDFSVAENPALIDRAFANLPTSLVDGDVELGESVTLETPTIVKGENETHAYYVSVEGPGGSAVINNNKFTPYAEGTYKLQYIGVVTGADGVTTYDIKSQEYTVVVKDTKAPTYSMEADVPAQLAVNSVFTFPVIGADDGEFGTGVDFEKSYVNLSSNNTSPVKYTLKELYSETRTKTLTREEEYTLTYYLVDNVGNNYTKTFKIAVGDTISPELKIEDGVIPATVGKGLLTIDSSKIKPKDNKSNLTVNDVKITVKNTDTNQTVDAQSAEGAGKYVFDIKNAGSYEIVFKVTDAAGHTTEKTKTFTVDAETNNGTEKTEVIGTILIVVSVLVLAGVILYFVLTKRKNDKMYKG